MRAARIFIIVCLAGLVSPVFAAFSGNLTALKTEIDERLGASPPSTQLKALASAKKSVDAASSSLSGDLKNFAKAQKSLAKTFAQDSEMSGILTAAGAGFSTDVHNARNALSARQSELFSSKAVASLQKSLTSIDVALMQADSATTLDAKIKALSKAQLLIDKANAAADKASGTGGFACKIEGAAFAPTSIKCFTDAGGLHFELSTGKGLTLKLLTFDISNPAVAEIKTKIDSNQRICIVTWVDAATTLQTGPFSSSFKGDGSLFITKFENGKIEGNFSFNIYSVLRPNDPLEITEGRFSLNYEQK